MLATYSDCRHLQFSSDYRRYAPRKYLRAITIYLFTIITIAYTAAECGGVGAAWFEWVTGCDGDCSAVKRERATESLKRANEEREPKPCAAVHSYTDGQTDGRADTFSDLSRDRESLAVFDRPRRQSRAQSRRSLLCIGDDRQSALIPPPPLLVPGWRT